MMGLVASMNRRQNGDYIRESRRHTFLKAVREALSKKTMFDAVRTREDGSAGAADLCWPPTGKESLG